MTTEKGRGNKVVISKKFYRDFSEKEIELFEELQDVMSKCYVFVPPFVINRMIERGMIPDDLDLIDESGEFVRENISLLNECPAYRYVMKTIDEGIVYEFSNEGISNPVSPYRIVFAGEYEKFVYFVKVSVPPVKAGIRVIDVWRKQGRMPLSPIREQRHLFARGLDWDISLIVSNIIDLARAEVAI